MWSHLPHELRIHAASPRASAHLPHLSSQLPTPYAPQRKIRRSGGGTHRRHACALKWRKKSRGVVQTRRPRALDSDRGSREGPTYLARLRHPVPPLSSTLLTLRSPSCLRAGKREKRATVSPGRAALHTQQYRHALDSNRGSREGSTYLSRRQRARSGVARSADCRSRARRLYEPHK